MVEIRFPRAFILVSTKRLILGGGSTREVYFVKLGRSSLAQGEVKQWTITETVNYFKQHEALEGEISKVLNKHSIDGRALLRLLKNEQHVNDLFGSNYGALYRFQDISSPLLVQNKK